jgi:septal ring factor EnvC (AmiA/AmiB activator)
MANDKKLIGVLNELQDTITHSKALKTDLEQQIVQTEAEIDVLEGKLLRLREYRAKLEGGIDVIDELNK